MGFSNFREYMQAWIVGLHLVLSTFIGLAMGYGLDYLMDKWFGWHTKPWLTVIFLIFGIIAGFKELYLMARKADRDSDKKNL